MHRGSACGRRVIELRERSKPGRSGALCGAAPRCARPRAIRATSSIFLLALPLRGALRGHARATTTGLKRGPSKSRAAGREEAGHQERLHSLHRLQTRVQSSAGNGIEHARERAAETERSYQWCTRATSRHRTFWVKQPWRRSADAAQRPSFRCRGGALARRLFGGGDAGLAGTPVGCASSRAAAYTAAGRATGRPAQHLHFLGRCEACAPTAWPAIGGCFMAQCRAARTQPRCVAVAGS